MKQYWKFTAIIVVVLASLAWLAVAGIDESSTYYITLTEMQQMQEKALERRLRVAGDVEAGSIVRSAKQVEFVLKQGDLKQKVVYTGRDPLPDTFKDHANALADGRLGRDGVFEATKIQAKCASKYEAKPGEQPAKQTAAPRT